MVDSGLKAHGSFVVLKKKRVIPERILAAQSPDVDTVSGATNSSRVIMHAMRRALEKASTVSE